jgi:hypothetical protein
VAAPRDHPGCGIGASRNGEIIEISKSITKHHPVVGIGIHVLGHAAQLVTQRAVDEPLLSKVTSRVERRYAPTSNVATQATAP